MDHQRFACHRPCSFVQFLPVGSASPSTSSFISPSESWLARQQYCIRMELRLSVIQDPNPDMKAKCGFYLDHSCHPLEVSANDFVAAGCNLASGLEEKTAGTWKCMSIRRVPTSPLSFPSPNPSYRRKSTPSPARVCCTCNLSYCSQTIMF